MMFVGQISWQVLVPQPLDGAVTVIVTVQELLLPAQSNSVNVIFVTPGPTSVPAGGVCEQLARQQLSLKHCE